MDARLTAALAPFAEPLATLPDEDRAALLAVLDRWWRHAPEQVMLALGGAVRATALLDPALRQRFLMLADGVIAANWADGRATFEQGAPLLHAVAAGQRARFLALALATLPAAGRLAYPAFADAATALGLLDAELHELLLDLAEQLAPLSGPAALAFLTATPTVLERLRVPDLAGWHGAGLAILRASEEGGLAYFRLESGKGEEVLESLSARVELGRVSEVLRLYCQALTGASMSIQATTALAEKGVGWVAEHAPTTEGSAVYLPAVVAETTDKVENFAIYKVYTTHQAAHLEFRSFQFAFERPAAVVSPPDQQLRPRRAALRLAEITETRRREALAAMAAEDRDSGDLPEKPYQPLTEMERFFDLFPERRLAADLFMVVEDGRIDHHIRQEYGGIKGPLGRVQRRELAERSPVERLPLRQALVENLVRVSLDGLDTVRWPTQYAPAMGAAIALLRQVQQPATEVEDAAEITIQLYDLAMAIPNVLPEDLMPEDWQQLDEEMISLDLVPQGSDGGEGMEQLAEGMPEGVEQPYESPEDVDFRGDFKPELVQLLMRLRNDAKQQGGEGQMTPLTPEQLQELLEKSVEIDISEFMDGDMSESSGMFLSNLMKEAGTPPQDGNGDKPMKDGQPADGEDSDDDKPLPPAIEYFFYDEWDFRANDYKPRWCRVAQRTLEEGEEKFFDKTLQSHSALVAQTRKQFELMRPELFRKLKKLYDGEDFDLDMLVEYAVDKRANITPNEKLYWRRNKIERDVAVAFLLDMSASTDEEITRRDRKQDDDDFDDDPRKYLTWWAQKRARDLATPPKRIIDVEKESTVLLMEALETIGDTYGIYGFSGYGRDNVEYYVIKDLMEPFNERVRNRIDKIVPIRSTRMGPALRHTISKLDQHDAKVKLLFLVSDGRPQDHGYGRDRTEKEYAIHDTKMALTEAKRKGIVPFCLTVDRAGHDYLKTMCEDIAYEVLADIEALPSRLPTLYRKLTE